MRVTDGSNYDAVRESIQRSKERMEGLQLQSSTMRKLNTPSDDPVGASKVLEIRTDKVNNEQFINNIHLTQNFMNNSDHALSEMVEVVSRCKEIAIGQASIASSTPESRMGVAEEVGQLFQQAVSAANRRIGSRYLFGGFKTETPPVDPNGRYHGDDGKMMVEVTKGEYVPMNLPGSEVFDTAPRKGGAEPQSSPENVNLFDEIQDLRIGLLTGDLSTIQGTLDRFDQLHGFLVSARAKVGSRLQGLESSSQALERHNITNAQLSQAIEDADMAQVVSDLAREESVLRNSLSSAHKLIQPNLMDFLK